MSENPNRVVFPLRTSVELFRDPASPTAHLRAKVGAVLFDEVMFEKGLYDVALTEQGYSDAWRPADGLSDEELAEARQLHEEGTAFEVGFGKHPRAASRPHPRQCGPSSRGRLRGTMSPNGSQCCARCDRSRRTG